MFTINTEAKANANAVTNFDNLRSIYEIKNSEFDVKFPSFLIRPLANNFFVLLAHSEKTEFKEHWEYRPDYCSHDSYNTVIYWPVLLYINQVTCIENWVNLDYVYIPSFDSLIDLYRDRIGDEVTEVDQHPKTPTLFKTSPLSL